MWEFISSCKSDFSCFSGFSESIAGIDRLFSSLPDQQNMFNEFQNDPESSGEWEFTFPSLESEDPISQRGVKHF